MTKMFSLEPVLNPNQMCLIVFAWKAHPRYPLILAANRDEFYKRPTQQAGFWEEFPKMVAGKDLKAGGTWMGITSSGRFASVTNYRDPANIDPKAKSRGDIPIDFLTGSDLPMDYLKKLDTDSENFNGFNVLLGDLKDLFHYSNYEDKINQISPGVHGLSNALLDTPWPKVSFVKNEFQKVISGAFSQRDLLDLMGQTETFADDQLPKTGVPYEWEKAISAVCIRTPTYGTCCTTIITIDQEGTVSFFEKTYPVGGRHESNYEVSFKI